jgi:hypothetical protein
MSVVTPVPARGPAPSASSFSLPSTPAFYGDLSHSSHSPFTSPNRQKLSETLQQRSPVKEASIAEINAALEKDAVSERVRMKGH